MNLSIQVDDNKLSGKVFRVEGFLYLKDAEDASESEEKKENPTPEKPDITPEEKEEQKSDTSADSGTIEEVPQPTVTADGYENDGNTTVIAYGKLKTLMNIRSGNTADSVLVATYRKNTFVPILQYCSNEWLRIVCTQSSSGYAYVCNVDEVYAIIGRDIYTVDKNDTIKTVAEKTLGDTERFEEIKALNEMKDNVVAEGLVLLIP